MAKSVLPPGFSDIERATYAYLKRLSRKLEQAQIHSRPALLRALKSALSSDHSTNLAIASFVLHASKMSVKTLPS
jgi:hypothetical protein